MLTVSHKIKLTVIAEDFSVEVDGGVPDAFKCEDLKTSLQSCPDSRASYYKIIVYSFLSTVVTFAILVSRFHNQGLGNFFIHAIHVCSRSNYL